MKKIIAIVISALTLPSAFSQSIESHIPESAQCVISLNGSSMTKKIGIKNLNKSAAFLDFASKVMFSGNAEHKIGDIGIDLKNDLYYFYNFLPNMNYSAFMYEIEKPKLFEKYIAEKNEKGEKVKTEHFNILFYKRYNDRDARDFLAWNDEFAIYVYMNRYIDENEYAAYSVDYDEIDEGYYESVEMAVEEEAVEESYEEREARLKAEQEAEVQRKAAEKEARRQAIIKHLTPIFTGTQESSILKNAKYVSTKDANADVRCWVNMKELYDPSSFRYPYYYYGIPRDIFRMFSTLSSEYFGNELVSNLYFKNGEVYWKTTIQHNESMQKYFEQIYSKSLPKNYMKYIESSNVLGVFSSSFNSQKLWEAYPSMYSSFLSGIEDGRYNEEFQVLMDFISIMLDEKALGDLATGDMVFVLKDFIEKEIQYKTYEYNNDYSERTEVTKTRKQMMPEFLAMVGTRNKPFIEKLLGLACKHEVMVKQNDFYYTTGEDRDFPFKLYFTIQDEIAFVSTNSNEIQQIIEGKSKSGIDKPLENKLLKNQSYVTLNLKELLSRINTEDLRPRDKASLVYAQNNTEDFDIVSNYNGGKMVTEMTLVAPKSSKNSALYIWEFIETMYNIEKN